MIGKVGQMNDNVQDQINTIYDRQKEVAIGVRNVNCLVCANEPKIDHQHGTDGRLYTGLLARDDNQESQRGLEEGQTKRLLNMRWDHLGLTSAQKTRRINIKSVTSQPNSTKHGHNNSTMTATEVEYYMQGQQQRVFLSGLNSAIQDQAHEQQTEMA